MRGRFMTGCANSPYAFEKHSIGESAVLRPRASGAIVWLQWPVCAAGSRRADRRNTSDTVNPHGAIGSRGLLRADIHRGKLKFLRNSTETQTFGGGSHSEPNSGAIPTGERGRSKIEGTSRSILAYFACIMACSAYRNTGRTFRLGTCTTRKLTPLPVQHPS